MRHADAVILFPVQLQGAHARFGKCRIVLPQCESYYGVTIVTEELTTGQRPNGVKVIVVVEKMLGQPRNSVQGRLDGVGVEDMT